MINKIFILLLHYRVSHGFGDLYSHWKCSKLSSLVEDVTPSFYSVLRGGCELIISTRPINVQQYAGNGRPCGIEGMPILFRWSSDKLAVVLQNSSAILFRLVDAAEELKNKETVSITFDSVTRLDISNGVILNSCHRHPAMSERDFLCLSYVPNNNEVTEIECSLMNGTYALCVNGTKFFLPTVNGEYGDSIASYLSENNEPYLWIKHRHNLFYNFKIAELKQGQVTKTNVSYFVRDRRPYEQHKFDIVYADAGGIIIKRCNIYERECLYRYSIPQHAKEEGPIPFKSFCLYLETIDIYPAIIFKNWTSPFKKVKSMDLQNQRGGMEDMVEKDQTPSTSHRPIQVLGFITFIYLCIFFFYAFKPHRTSNLVELSAMMEDELTRLSILTNEAVEKIRVTRAEKISPSLLLMKHPEDPTQESLEDVCCPGSTCDASLCINEHHLHETLSPKRNLFYRRAKVHTCGIDAMSRSIDNKIDMMIVPIAKCERHIGRHAVVEKRARKPHPTHPPGHIYGKRRIHERRALQNRKKYNEEKHRKPKSKIMI